MATLLHGYTTAAQLHGYTAALLHGYTAALLHGYTAALLHDCTILLHGYSPDTDSADDFVPGIHIEINAVVVTEGASNCVGSAPPLPNTPPL